LACSTTHTTMLVSLYLPMAADLHDRWRRGQAQTKGTAALATECDHTSGCEYYRSAYDRRLRCCWCSLPHNSDQADRSQSTPNWSRLLWLRSSPLCTAPGLRLRLSTSSRACTCHTLPWMRGCSNWKTGRHRTEQRRRCLEDTAGRLWQGDELRGASKRRHLGSAASIRLAACCLRNGLVRSFAVGWSPGRTACPQDCVAKRVKPLRESCRE
jgi:hypothetical protein